MMRKTLLALIAFVILPQMSFTQRIKGSDTLLPFSQKAAELYMKNDIKATVTVTGGGSGVGISALLEGTTDIAQSSRKIKFDERKKLSEKGHKIKEVIVAYDALAVIIHPSNKVKNLTREQLEAIFTGKITNWKEVGGADMKIVPYSRETSSGTYEFFKEVVLQNRNYTNGILSMPATGAIVQSISQTKGGIGYIGLAYLNGSVKAVNISYDGGKNFVEPTADNATKALYPVVRPLYYYYVLNQEAKVKPFIDYLLSQEGQALVDEIGFIKVK